MKGAYANEWGILDLGDTIGPTVGCAGDGSCICRLIKGAKQSGSADRLEARFERARSS